MKTETLPSDHSFFNAWGPPHTGMGYRGLDFFEIGAQQAVDILSAEDWLGLNHMYGPELDLDRRPGLRLPLARSCGAASATGRSPCAALITPSDDGYLRLKAYSALGQGAKSFFFWTFGPTYIGTENYWSDLRSEYDGIAKLTRGLGEGGADPLSGPAGSRPGGDPLLGQPRPVAHRRSGQLRREPAHLGRPAAPGRAARLPARGGRRGGPAGHATRCSTSPASA